MKRRKIDIPYVKKYIQVHHPGSKLLSATYKNNKTPLKFVCENGHVFTKEFNNLLKYEKSKTVGWCKYCNEKFHEKKSIEYIKFFIRKKYPKAKVLSEEYKCAKTKIKIECENKHIFETNWNDLSSGHWCCACHGIKKKTIKDVCDFIQENHYGAKIISKKYINSSEKIKIKCENGHIFKISWSLIKSNHWCKYCNIRKGEWLVGIALSELTNFKFESQQRFKTLINPKTKKQLILDFICFNPKIIVEYNGVQHYKIIEKFHRGNTENERLKKLEYQKYRDNLKKIWAKENGYIFIEIMQIDYLKYNNVKKNVSYYLKKEYII